MLKSAEHTPALFPRVGIPCDLRLTNQLQRTSSPAPRAAASIATCRMLGTALKRNQMSLLRRLLQITQHRENVRALGCSK